MSGHNKWSKIKHKKAASDAKKSQVFSKLAKLIASESKKAEGNVESPGLRAAIREAKKENMPSDNIDRAVKKGMSLDAAVMENVMYEAYGPGGVALIIEGLTDNKNRTAAEIKHLLSKYAVELAGPGAATWAFEKNGIKWTPKTTMSIPDEDGERLAKLTDALEEHDDVQNIFTNAE